SLGAILKASDTLSRSANEISSAVQDQASVSAQQSSSVSEISSTVEELSQSSSQVAGNANHVAEFSANALRESERGVETLETLKAKMDEITDDNHAGIKEIVDLGKKSNEIGKVKEIINNIADQTKLIAFNAAIEASSAGEAGKRFGVVAVEIRRLADNVMESTGEIQGKIDEIQQAINRLVITSEKGSKRIQEGTQLTAQTIDELEKLVEGAKATADAAAQISLSTRQQKTATDQVLLALKEIVKGSRQSSSAIKQTSAVTAKLSEMSNELKVMLGKFKVEQTS
ncbi:MAG: methyl-accepting chemotaxis protein, partial [Nitrospinae bacterium]|nr:methyl-accepting chemotaxis protein [Nitrospinota bacterium]